MEGIFTLPYSEFEVINTLQKKFTKKAWYAFYIPTSRQQKWIDFIIHNYKNNKIIRIQVKSSRSFENESKLLKSGRKKYRYNLRFNNFVSKYNENNCDYYLLFWLYPSYNIKNNIKSKSAFWKTVILCFSEKEMKEYLSEIKTKREKKEDKFFWFWFDEVNKIFWTRWLNEDKNISKFLLENKFEDIKKSFK